jgi:hypothetical protein
LQSPDNVDGRADEYALAMMMYRALAGHEAMPELAQGDDRNVAAMVQAQKRKRHLRELLPELPARVASAIMRGAEPPASRRFGTMRELAAELRACREEIRGGVRRRTWSRRRWMVMVMLAVGLLGGMAAVTVLSLRRSPESPPPPAKTESSRSTARKAAPEPDPWKEVRP